MCAGERGRERRSARKEEAEGKTEESQEEAGECTASGQHFHALIQGLCEDTMGCIGSRTLSKPAPRVFRFLPSALQGGGGGGGSVRRGDGT